MTSRIDPAFAALRDILRSRDDMRAEAPRLWQAIVHGPLRSLATTDATLMKLALINTLHCWPLVARSLNPKLTQAIVEEVHRAAAEAFKATGLSHLEMWLLSRDVLDGDDTYRTLSLDLREAQASHAGAPSQESARVLFSALRALDRRAECRALLPALKALASTTRRGPLDYAVSWVQMHEVAEPAPDLLEPSGDVVDLLRAHRHLNDALGLYDSALVVDCLITAIRLHVDCRGGQSTLDDAPIDLVALHDGCIEELAALSPSRYLDESPAPYLPGTALRVARQLLSRQFRGKYGFFFAFIRAGRVSAPGRHDFASEVLDQLLDEFPAYADSTRTNSAASRLDRSTSFQTAEDAVRLLMPTWEKIRAGRPLATTPDDGHDGCLRTCLSCLLKARLGAWDRRSRPASRDTPALTHRTIASRSGCV